METLTIAGHTYKRLRVEGHRLAAELERISKALHPLRLFVRPAEGCVLKEVSHDEHPGEEKADCSYLVLIEEGDADA
jgi:hypothetical protein